MTQPDTPKARDRYVVVMNAIGEYEVRRKTEQGSWEWVGTFLDEAQAERFADALREGPRPRWLSMPERPAPGWRKIADKSPRVVIDRPTLIGTPESSSGWLLVEPQCPQVEAAESVLAEADEEGWAYETGDVAIHRYRSEAIGEAKFVRLERVDEPGRYGVHYLRRDDEGHLVDAGGSGWTYGEIDLERPSKPLDVLDALRYRLSRQAAEIAAGLGGIRAKIGAVDKTTAILKEGTS